MNKLDYVKDRVIVSVDMDGKNWHTMPDGTKIRLERKYDNFNARYTQPVNAIVIAGENIPEGSQILIHHNSCHDTNRIFNYKQVSGVDIASDIRYYSIHVTECFAWYDKNGWKPMPGFDFALRVFMPYNGVIEGIEPTLLKNTLYMLTGKYKEQVCLTLKACDYEIIYQDTNGREGNLIRIRTEGEEKTLREPEVVAIHHDLTRQVINNEVLIGITKSDAKPLNKFQYA